MSDHAPVLSPAAQARYHLGCAVRHVGKAARALWLSDFWGFYFPLGAVIALGLLCSGCVTSGNGVRWSPLVPTTWPIFSGESAVNRSRKAADRLDRQAAAIAAIKWEAVHAAHLEFYKSYTVLGQTYPLQLRDLAMRFTGNGLSLLDQADPLTAAERDNARGVANDFVSGEPARVNAAEASQSVVEKGNGEISRRLDSAEAKAAKLSQLLRTANADLRETASENIALANQVRIFRWLVGTLAVLLVLAAAAAIYARLALGGVGAALHAAGAPAQVITALDGELSKLGQWAIRTGRRAAAKLDALRAIEAPGTRPSNPKPLPTGSTPVG